MNPDRKIVSNAELTKVVADAHRRGQRLNLELVSRQPVQWKVTRSEVKTRDRQPRNQRNLF